MASRSRNGTAGWPRPKIARATSALNAMSVAQGMAQPRARPGMSRKCAMPGTGGPARASRPRPPARAARRGAPIPSAPPGSVDSKTSLAASAKKNAMPTSLAAKWSACAKPCVRRRREVRPRERDHGADEEQRRVVHQQPVDADRQRRASRMCPGMRLHRCEGCRRLTGYFGSTWPPNCFRIADRSFSANVWSWRDRNRA